MKYKLYILVICVAVLAFGSAQASVFSSSSASSLQSQFNGLGYGHIDVTNYQTDLNMKLAGMVDFQILSKGGSISNLSFGVLQGHERWWGTYYSHHEVFGEGAGIGATGSFDMSNPSSNYGFYIQKRDPYRWWRRTRYYSYSPFNRYGAVQALFYQDPLNSGSYLMAWSGHTDGDTHYDKRYDDMVVRMTVHPAPEPATWVLLATGLLGIGVFVTARRKPAGIR